MPIIFGIAAIALLANGNDQTGVDPQIDKQYAIVKPAEHVVPAVAQTNTTKATDEAPLACSKSNGLNVRGEYQEGSATQSGNLILFQTASSSTASGQGGRIELSSQAASGPTSPQAPSRYLATPSAPSPFGQRAMALPGMTLFGSDNLSRLKGMDRQVSVQFTNASASDVLKWLAKQNVNFVANVDKLPKTKITMNVNHVPLHEALETVAESLGGSWQVKGSTLMFRTEMFRGPMSFTPARTGGLGSMNWTTPSAPGDWKAFSKMDENQMKAFEKSMLDMKGEMKSFQFDSKALSELKGLNQDGKAFTYKFDPKAMEGFKALNRDGKAFTFKMDPKALAEMKNFKEWPGYKGMTFNKIDTEKFSKSLTSDQNNLMKKQGYLKFSDLTEAQRAILFTGSIKELPQDFTFVFSTNGKKITIKSK